MLAAVVFDFDGILVDSEPLHHRAFLQVLEPLGMAMPWEEYCETYIGFDDRDALKAIFRKHRKRLGPAEMKRLIARKADAFQALVAAGGATPLPGAVDLVRSLPARIPLALCSGALRQDILPILASLGIEDAFNTVVTAEETDRSKPDPAPYRLAIDRLGIGDPAAAVAIEDTPAGILSAKGAGLKVLAVTNSYDREYLLEADAVVDSLEDVSISLIEDLVP